ncbi:hypothetical protein GDO81_001601 [Engystomops pustulosus]|uniref:Uncharacterized protein n=1 Tax=Engystomops pustulosus TaxID=76066 RepID=A0AAV7DHP9_ENGPU|nr:hypothetical protein GDO81_001601 [Engystomops pustulosus]
MYVALCSVRNACYMVCCCSVHASVRVVLQVCQVLLCDVQCLSVLVWRGAKWATCASALWRVVAQLAVCVARPVWQCAGPVCGKCASPCVGKCAKVPVCGMCARCLCVASVAGACVARCVAVCAPVLLVLSGACARPWWLCARCRVVCQGHVMANVLGARVCQDPCMACVASAVWCRGHVGDVLGAGGVLAWVRHGPVYGEWASCRVCVCVPGAVYVECA